METAHAGVNIHGLEYPMRIVLCQAYLLYKALGEECIVTSARDGVHSPSSYHYFGYAVDFRTRNLSDDQAKEVAKKLQSRLGNKYDVILHTTHLHVEYDYEKAIQNEEENFLKKISANSRCGTQVEL